MKLKQIIVGETIVIDKITERVSIINVMDSMVFTNFPVQIPFFIYSVFENNEERDVTISLRYVISNNGNKLIEIPFELIFKPNLNLAKNIALRRMITIESPVPVQIDVFNGDGVIGTSYIYIFKKEE